MKYLTLGTDEITEEKFRTIQDREDSIKPKGGLWLTEQPEEHTAINFNRWIDFIFSKGHRNIFFDKYSPQYNWKIPCSLVTLKEDSKIFKLDNKKQLQYLIDNYKSDNLFTIKGLSEQYDGIFIKLLGMMGREIDWEISKKFETFGVDTLLIFNPNCINFYQKGEVKIEPFDQYDYIKQILYSINIEEEKKRVLKR